MPSTTSDGDIDGDAVDAPATVLLLEDDPADAMLVEHTLQAQLPHLRVEHAANRDDYADRLTEGGIDLVLSDGSVPGCEGLEAFHLARQQDAGLPFIYISGFEDPQRDVHGLRALGISAVLSKSRLDDLAPAVRHALHPPPDRTTQPPHLIDGQAVLVGAVRELSTARDLPAIMAVVRRTARRLTGADGATFVLRDGDRCFYADEDAIAPLWKGQRFPIHSCLSGWAMRHRQPAVVEDVLTDQRVPLAAYEPTFVRSVVMVPIRAVDPIGAIGTYWSTKRLPDPAETRLLLALADTTAVAMENVAMHRDLERRVQERTAELEAFTYAVSHDLRAPIRHVQGFARIALEDDEDPPGGQPRAMLERIVGSATTMGDMVGGLLDLSRTSQHQLKRVPVDLAALALEVARDLEATAGHAVQFVPPPGPVPVLGDPRLLRIALQNLLGNAWKFTSATDGARVELAVRTGPDGRPLHSVRDNGAGFDPAAAHRLFKVFQRLHRAEEFPGIGCGLASVRRIVVRHGGRIWADGSPGAGATFFFTLPDAADLPLQALTDDLG